MVRTAPHTTAHHRHPPSPASTDEPRSVTVVLWVKHTLAPWVGGHTLLAACIAGAALLAGRWAVTAWQGRGKHTGKRPTKATVVAAKLAPRVGYKDTPPSRWLTWPKDPEATGAVVKIVYEPHWAATERDVAAVLGIVRNHAHAGQWAESHDHNRNTLTFTRQAPAAPPDRLPTHATYDGRLSTQADRVPFAVKVTGQPLIADLTNLTPHVLVSASTGWGKTTTVSVFIAHVAGNGGLVTVCDPKRIGYVQAFAGLPNVQLHTTAAAMVAAIGDVRREVDARYRTAEAEGHGVLDDRRRFPLILLVVDEVGSLVQMAKVEAGVNRPPVVDELLGILRLGRAAAVHVVTAAQQANAAALTGSEARDQYALRIAAGPQSRASWAMLFDTEPQPPAEPIKGRATIGVGPDLVAAQLVTLTADDARAVASRGRAVWPTKPVLTLVPDASKGPNNPPSKPGTEQPQPFTPPETAVSDVDWDAEWAALHAFTRGDTGPASTGGHPEPPAARRGRPPTVHRALVDVECGCGMRWRSSAASGSRVRCPAKCGASVPVPAR